MPKSKKLKKTKEEPEEEPKIQEIKDDDEAAPSQPKETITEKNEEPETQPNEHTEDEILLPPRDSLKSSTDRIEQSSPNQNQPTNRKSKARRVHD